MVVGERLLVFIEIMHFRQQRAVGVWTDKQSEPVSGQMVNKHLEIWVRAVVLVFLPFFWYARKPSFNTFILDMTKVLARTNYFKVIRDNMSGIFRSSNVGQILSDTWCMFVLYAARIECWLNIHTKIRHPKNYFTFSDSEAWPQREHCTMSTVSLLIFLYIYW